MFKVFYQSYCDYSQKTLSSINKFKLKSELIQCDNNENFINNEDSKHIPIHYTTYPKILFKTDKKILFIGGNEEFQKLLILLDELKKDINFKIDSQKYIKKNETCYILTKIV
jgi:hypothetical protein